MSTLEQNSEAPDGGASIAIQYCYSNNGASMRVVGPDTDGAAYVAAPGEVLFDVPATVEQLIAAFPGYGQAGVQQAYMLAVQDMLDAKARERAYDGILSACTYVDDVNPRFAAEGAACKAWRSAVWAQCYADLAAVQSGAMQQPSIGDFLASLPQLTWPEV